MSRLLIVGAGGHGRSVAEAALLSGVWKSIVFSDANWPDLTEVFGWQVVGHPDELAQQLNNIDGVIVAIGNNKVRQQLVTFLEVLQAPLVSVIHPAAFVSPSAIIGVGTAVMAGAVIGTEAVVGKAAIINCNSVVDHHAKLKDFAHLSVKVGLAGGVEVGQGAWLQAGVSAGYHVKVADWVVVSPGIALSV